ncbi:MAG TPA: DUF4920 domain-containing protein [Pyrinomonadaceae bacterium]|jgi:hypothetical protein|nr:DUF4920 domain-containing protein [Pyrinomonadaceae bacterium]
MKTFLYALTLTCCLALGAVAQDHSHHAGAKQDDTAAISPEVVKRGEPIGKSPAVSFADVLKDPSKFTGKVVRIEGVVEKVCKAQGCWMEISPEAGAATVRVTFKNQGFFVPKDSNSMKFRAEGEFGIKVLTKEQVDHLVNEDGATIRRNDDGTANEVIFVAKGVELWK